MPKYYTIEQAADAIGTNRDGVFALAGEIFSPASEGVHLSAPRNDSGIAFACQIDSPLSAKEVGGNSEMIELPPGVYEIGVFPYSDGAVRIEDVIFDRHGRARVNLLTKVESIKKVVVESEKDGKVIPVFDQELNLTIRFSGWFENSKSYILTEPIDVYKKHLVILTGRLNCYLESVGKKLPRQNYEAEKGLQYCKVIDEKQNQDEEKIEVHCTNSFNSTQYQAVVQCYTINNYTQTNVAEPSAEPLLQQETGENISNVSGEAQHQTCQNKSSRPHEKHPLVWHAIERIFVELTNEAGGKHPQYGHVLERLKDDVMEKKGGVANLVKSVSKRRGIILVSDDDSSRGNSISVRTVKNRLTEIREKYSKEPRLLPLEIK